MLFVKQFIEKFVQLFYAHKKEVNLKLFIKSFTEILWNFHQNENTFVHSI